MAAQFTLTAKESMVTKNIAERACRMDLLQDDSLSLQMDLDATHSNGCRLDFQKLLKADDFNFMHDILGIQAHIDRNTGKLTGFFSPRCSIPRLRDSTDGLSVGRILTENGHVFRSDFPDWLADNFHVYSRFKLEAEKIRARGRTHYSARTIIEVLRHESSLADTGQPWKINDNYVPDLARLYMLETGHEMFELRVQKNSERLG